MRLDVFLVTKVTSGSLLRRIIYPGNNTSGIGYLLIFDLKRKVMGMYDTIGCPFVMPDGSFQLGEDAYQFYEFSMLQSKYAIGRDGKLVLKEDRSNGTDLTSHVDYTGNIVVHTDSPKGYMLHFENSYLKKVELVDWHAEEGDPSNPFILFEDLVWLTEDETSPATPLSSFMGHLIKERKEYKQLILDKTGTSMRDLVDDKYTEQ
jgi:hypothetical protein